MLTYTLLSLTISLYQELDETKVHELKERLSTLLTNYGFPRIKEVSTKLVKIPIGFGEVEKKYYYTFELEKPANLTDEGVKDLREKVERTVADYLKGRGIKNYDVLLNRRPLVNR